MKQNTPPKDTTQIEERVEELKNWLDMRIEAAHNASNLYRLDFNGEKVRTPQAEKAYYFQQAFEIVALRVKYLFKPEHNICWTVTKLSNKNQKAVNANKEPDEIMQQWFEDDDLHDHDECCEDCGCYHGHNPWCYQSEEYREW